MTEFNHQPPAGDALDRAAAAVRGQAIPAPSADLTAATLAAVHNRLQLAEARARRRRWIVRGASIGGLAACLAVAVSWGSTASATEGLERTARAVAAAKSVRVGQTVLDVKTGLPGHATQVWLRDGAYRKEARQGPDAERVTTVVDLTTRTQLNLYTDIVTKAPTAQVDRLSDEELAEARGWFVETFRPVTLATLRGEKRVELAVTRLPDEPVNGRPHRVYQIDVRDDRPGRERLWVDAATDLPSREVFFSDTDAWVTVYADWNAVFDDKLFSTAAPAGHRSPGEGRPSDKTFPVSLTVALENQEKVKSFRAVVRTTLAAGVKPSPDQKVYHQGEQTRMEVGDLTVVGNGKTGELLMLDAKSKTARVGKMEVVGRTDLAKGVTEGVKKVLAAQTETDRATPVPAVEIGGKKRDGYRVSGVPFGPGQTADVVFYLDAERQLPLRYELTTTGPIKMTSVMEFLGYDEELDPKLFELTVPEGYKREDLKLPDGPAKK